MKEDNFGKFPDNEMMDLLNKYERLVQEQGQSYYFDVEEYEILISHFLDANKKQEASQILENALEQHPATPGIRLQEAKVLFAGGKAKKAYTILNEIEKLESSRYEIYMLKALIQIYYKNFKQAENLFFKAEKYALEGKADLYYSIAIALETSRQYKSALKYYKKSYQELEGSDSELLYDIAFCAEKAGKLFESIRLYQAYLQKNPFSETAWYNLGVNYHNKENYSQALKAYEYALSINPEYALGLQGKAESLKKTGALDEASQAYKDYLEIMPYDAESYYEIGECYRQKNCLHAAVKWYDKAIEQDEQLSEAFHKLGVVKFRQDKVLESIIEIKKAVDLTPYNPDYWFSLGLSCQKLSFKEDAAAAFEKALNLYPYDPDFWVNYADMKFEEGDVVKAIELLKEGDVVNKETARIKYRLAAYHLASKATGPALDYFTHGLKIDANESVDFFNFYPDAQNVDEINAVLMKFK